MSRRLFVSVDLPAGLESELAAIQDEFADASGLRFVDPAGAHLTLKFLGDVDDDRLDDLESELAAAVADAGVDPFAVRFGGLGVFPDLEYVRVLWLGVETGGDELVRLHGALEERTTAMGFDPETHEFTPHVTLARMEHAGGKDVVQRLVRDPDWKPTLESFRVDDVRLTESTLTSDGPAYATIERFSLE